MAKKATVSSDTSWVKERLIFCFLNGPLQRLAALGRVDLQWRLGTGWCGRVGVGDSPLTSGEVSLVVNPCILKWSRSRGKGVDGAICGLLVGWCGCGFMA